MAPLPESNTNRLLVDYVVNSADKHTLMFRFPESITSEQAVTKINDVLTELDDAFYTDTIFESARWAEKGSEISFPVPWTPVNGATASGSRPVDFRARFFSMVGRSTSGRNWHLSFFGATLLVDANFRILDSEAPALVAVREALLSGGDPLVAIDENMIVPLNYFTSRVSAYWQRKIARGG